MIKSGVCLLSCSIVVVDQGVCSDLPENLNSYSLPQAEGVPFATACAPWLHLFWASEISPVSLTDLKGISCCKQLSWPRECVWLRGQLGAVWVDWPKLRLPPNVFKSFRAAAAISFCTSAAIHLRHRLTPARWNTSVTGLEMTNEHKSYFRYEYELKLNLNTFKLNK